jgi:hypothetical protein
MHKQAIHINKLAAQKLAAVLISMEHTIKKTHTLSTYAGHESSSTSLGFQHVRFYMHA